MTTGSQREVRAAARSLRRGFGLILVGAVLALVTPLVSLVARDVTAVLGWGTAGLLVGGLLAFLGLVLVAQGIVDHAANADLRTEIAVRQLEEASERSRTGAM